MEARKPRKPRPALDAPALDELALAYVGRFATSKARLVSYLWRKLRERGWAGSVEPDPEGLADRLVRLGYVDDRAFALAKARSLSARGYGEGRLRQALYQSGIPEEEAVDARELARGKAVDAALQFARRRRFGPFAEKSIERADRERALASMLRAGHGLALARAILDLPPGAQVDPESLRESG